MKVLNISYGSSLGSNSLLVYLILLIQKYDSIHFSIIGLKMVMGFT